MEDTQNFTLTDDLSVTVFTDSALSEYLTHGLSVTARKEIEEQIANEQNTAGENPLAYRLSEDESLKDSYRSADGLVTEEGLLRYAGENRAIRIRETDFSADVMSVYDTAEAHALEPVTRKETILDTAKGVGEKLKSLPTETLETVKKRSPLWFDARKGTTENETRKFPLSAFAAVIAIAISMMLIVSGSLLVIGAETKISRLNSDISDLHEEITDLKSELESKVDLAEIRRIATEEYGMVDEDYLKMDYIQLDSDEISAVKGEKKDGIGLSGLLSAIRRK